MKRDRAECRAYDVHDEREHGGEASDERFNTEQRGKGSWQRVCILAQDLALI